MPCELCLIDSPLIQKERLCCQLRELVKAQKHIRIAHWRTLTGEERTKLGPQLIVEHDRLKALNLSKKKAKK